MADEGVVESDPEGASSDFSASNRFLFRYGSQSSLDESSQKHLPKSDSKHRFQYRNVQHFPRAFDNLDLMRRQTELCDVVLIADDYEISAHKIVLASCSPYFHAMFTSFEESRQDRIVLQDISGEALQLLVNYAYSAEVEVTENNVQVLLPASNILQLTDVRDACCEFLQSQLDPSNCLGIRDFADLHACLDLLAIADSYAEQHFADVVESEEFMGLEVQQVIRLISSDKLSTPSEEKVFESVLSWVNSDLPAREEHLAKLMECVRFPLLPEEYLVSRVRPEPLLKSNAQCKDYLIEALTYHLVKDKQKSSYRTLCIKQRQPVTPPKVLLVMGGQAPKAIRSVECFNFKEDKWFTVAEMPDRRCRCGIAVIGGKVYAVGGFNGRLRVRSVDMYDPATDMWSSCTDMEARRSTLGVATLNNHIYAVGGFDGSTGLNSAEVYDLQTCEWSLIAPMCTRRSSVGVGVVQGLLYAVGGYDGASRECLASVECYCPEDDTWSTVAEMSARRSGAGVGVLKNSLYAVGGHDGPLVRKSVEVYSPETNSWKPVADMTICRRNAGVVAMNDLLYVVGGEDGASNLSSVEVYNPENDTWTLLPSQMAIGRSYAGVAIM